MSKYKQYKLPLNVFPFETPYIALSDLGEQSRFGSRKKRSDFKETPALSLRLRVISNTN